MPEFIAYAMLPIVHLVVFGPFIIPAIIDAFRKDS